MKIRKSTEKDISDIMFVYEKARSFMKLNGNGTQWGDNWPPIEIIKNDIKNKNHYVLTHEEKIVGCFYYTYGIEDDTYKNYNNIWISDTPYGVIHRLASSGEVKGVGEFIINWVYNDCHHVRIDTHENNIPMRNLLKKLGFTYCGTIDINVKDNILSDTKRLTFEKT